MSTPKYQRELRKAIKPLGWWIRRRQSGATHLILTDGKNEMTASLSPKNIDHSVKASVRNIKRYYKRGRIRK